MSRLGTGTYLWGGKRGYGGLWGEAGVMVGYGGVEGGGEGNECAMLDNRNSGIFSGVFHDSFGHLYILMGGGGRGGVAIGDAWKVWCY